MPMTRHTPLIRATAVATLLPLTVLGGELTISGTAPPFATVGEEYHFLPVVTQGDSSRLEFNYIDKPSWSKTYRSSGLIQGLPTEPAVYRDIQIGVWDGTQYAVTPPFTITVLPAPLSGLGMAHLTWIRPDVNDDGSSLTNLAGFEIHYGTTPAADRQIGVDSPNQTELDIDGLSAGDWYFEIAAVNSQAERGDFSGLVRAAVR